jgi:type I restriction enzyme S subunit
MTKKSDAPAIRFKGFSDAWEQRKLEDYLTVSAEKNTGNIYGRSDVLSVSGDYGIVNQIEFQGRSFAGASVSNYGVVQTGDVVYTKSPLNSNPYGIIKTNKGKPGIVSTLYAVYHPKENAFSDFIQVYFEQHARMNNYMHPLVNKGAKNDMKVSAENALKGPVCFPSRIEQESISAFFSVLDNLITLHQRKFEKLTNVKKSMLEKMFPQNGSSYPEIRFKGFTDPWEQRKLSEITDKVTEKNSGLQYVETFTNSAEFGIISQRDFFDHDIAKLGSLDGYYIVKNEDFVYNPRISTSAPVGPINRNKLGRTGVMSPLYTVFRPHDIDTTYLEYFFKCGYWHSFMNFNGDSGARSDRFSIRDNVFFQMPIPIPDIDEQRKIGELLTCLDNLITLHQRELEKLQNIKKSMLEKMFV